MGVFDTATKKITDLLGITSKGQATMANSVPVALASDQSSIAATVVGNVAHDATDSGNPVKIGGKASTSEPAAVANGDRVNAYLDERGRIGVHATGTILPIAGDVNAVVQGSTPHDGVDSGNPVKIGGKAAASLPAQVASGDRVDAYFDRNGRQVIYNETIGATDDAVVEGDVAGTLSAKLRGLQKVFGAVGDAAASGAASVSAKLRSIATAIGAANDAQAYGITDGTVIAKLKGVAGGIGALDVAASHGDSDGSLIAKFKAFLVTLGQSSDAADEDGSISAKTRRMAGAIGEVDGNPYDPETDGFTVATIQSALRYLADRREAVVEMHQYRSSVILVPENGTAALINSADDITEASALASPSSLAHDSWTADPQYIWIPYDAAQRYLLMVVNNFNQSINVELAGVSWGEIAETAMEYNAQPLQASATTIGIGQQAVWTAYGGLGSVAALQVLPILDAPWNWLRLTITPAGNPTAGSLQLTFQYRKE